MARVGAVSGGTVIDETTFGNALITDYLSQTDTSTQAVASDVNMAAGKRLKADFIYFNPTTVPASVEGNEYYDSTAKCKKVYNGTSWLDIPAAEGGGGVERQPNYYLVYKSGSNWEAQNGATGAVDSSNANPTTVINYALANLTGSRSWKDRVVVKGDV